MILLYVHPTFLVQFDPSRAFTTSLWKLSDCEVVDWRPFFFHHEKVHFFLMLNRKPTTKGFSRVHSRSWPWTLFQHERAIWFNPLPKIGASNRFLQYKNGTNDLLNARDQAKRHLSQVTQINIRLEEFPTQYYSFLWSGSKKAKNWKNSQVFRVEEAPHK